MADIEALKNQIAELQLKLADLEASKASSEPSPPPRLVPVPHLSNDEIKRYGRQIIVEDFGIKGQEKLRNTSFLVIGAGGLGCPAAIYLAGAGAGRIGLVDYDAVEKHNLHRQILHDEANCGLSKAESAKKALLRLNANVEVVAHNVLLSSSNATELFKLYDVILDCTDNAVTRYLINDACVLLGRPLVSGAALRTEGQLTVYHHRGAPCYRCLFPVPPPREAQGNCSDQGVLGPVPGTIGCLQALEAIKIACGLEGDLAGRLLTFDAINATFRTIKLRPKSPNCKVCGTEPTIRELIDYEEFCSAKADDKPQLHKFIDDSLSVTPKEYSDVVNSKKAHLLVDVRPKVQFDICHLPNSQNIPIGDLGGQLAALKSLASGGLPVYLICRRGNDSQLATKQLLDSGVEYARNIAGGLSRWTAEIDPSFPSY